MLHFAMTPSQLYSRVDLDARIEGSSGSELTAICFDALKRALKQAALAAKRAQKRDAAEALARAATILGGLQRAVDADAPMGGTLLDFYNSISVRLIGLMSDPKDDVIGLLEADISEVAAALLNGQEPSGS